jgi:ATPase family AAA domain-containing protein 3A/B
MDEALEFPLPNPGERKKMLQLYMDAYITKAGTAEGGAGAGTGGGLKQRIDNFLRGRKQSADRIAVVDITEQTLQHAAELMEGFSGREIAKFIASVQAAVYGSHEAQLTAQMFESVLQHKLQEHKQREAFRQGQHTANTAEKAPAHKG